MVIYRICKTEFPVCTHKLTQRLMMNSLYEFGHEPFLMSKHADVTIVNRLLNHSLLYIPFVHVPSPYHQSRTQQDHTISPYKKHGKP